MDGIKLITLNFEGERHLARVSAFLASEKPDVICLQEVLSRDVSYLKDLLGMDGEYAAMLSIGEETQTKFPVGSDWGVLLLTKFKEVKLDSYYYVGSSDPLPTINIDDPNDISRVLVTAEFNHDDFFFRFATTHFTWSLNGETLDIQRTQFEQMVEVLNRFDRLILCGDFNAPRGEEIWGELSQKYTDNIPQNITTTIDQELHRVKGIQFVVDGIFSTPEYDVYEVKVSSGISDHMAVVATIRPKHKNPTI